jgi:hypothetical protein
VPGDGIFTTWSYRAGAGRAEAFLLNPQPLTAQTAHEWGGNELPACSRQNHNLVLSILADPVKGIDKSDHILGFTTFGVGAGEILAAVQIAMIAGLPYTALRAAVLTHPTLVEGLIPLFSSAASALVSR